MTSPAILVAWDYVPRQPPPGVACEFAEDAPSLVLVNLPGDAPGQVRPEMQPLIVTFDRARIRELLEPYEADHARVRWLAVLDPARLRARSFLRWIPTTACPDAPRGTSPMETAALIDADDIARWLAPSAAAR